MIPYKRDFVLLCAAEASVVLAGMVSIPAALVLQFFLPILIFRGIFTPARTGVIFVLAYGGGLAMVFAVFLSFRHVTLPLLLLSAIMVLALFALLLGESRIRRRFGGVIP